MKHRKTSCKKSLIRMLAVFLAVITPGIGHSSTWYVDANNGNDIWDGTTATRDEGADTGPKKTLAAIAACTKANDTIYAAPGYYSNNTVTVDGRLYRVCVTNYASLIATSSPKDTFIVGAETTDATQGDAYGNGPGAISGVYLYKNSTLQGFTVTGGRTLDDSMNDAGGGVCGIGSAEVKDCIISNNAAAYRGGGVCGVKAGATSVGKGPSVFRCLFVDNVAVSYAHSGWNLTAVNDCIFSSSVAQYQLYQCNSIGNCTFVGTGTHVRNSKAANCLMLSRDGGNNNLTNCFYVGALATGSTAYSSSRQITADQAELDEHWIPAKTSVVVDAGDASYYSNAERKDVYGGQRVYNGKIDVGAVEYDWRGDFGVLLDPVKGRAEVVSAGENVTTNIVSGILVPGGQAVEIDYSPKCNTSCHFTAVPAAGGSVDVRNGDIVLSPDLEGQYTYSGKVGRNRVLISYSGSGEASVFNFFDDGPGLCVIIK